MLLWNEVVHASARVWVCVCAMMKWENGDEEKAAGNWRCGEGKGREGRFSFEIKIYSSRSLNTHTHTHTMKKHLQWRKISYLVDRKARLTLCTTKPVNSWPCALEEIRAKFPSIIIIIIIIIIITHAANPITLLNGPQLCFLKKEKRQNYTVKHK